MGIWSKLAGSGAEIEAHEVVTRAMHGTGASDFGSDAWSEPLEVLTRSINTEANLHRAGKRAAREFLTKLLSGRAESPATDDRTNDDSLPRPIVIVGIDGSGAHHLARAVRSERKRRFPFGTTVAPSIETRLFLQEFTSFEFERRWHVPAYSEWLAQADLGDSYASASARLARSHRVFDWPEESLANGVSDLIVLQGEHHLEHLPLLAEALPDATVLHLHRSPGVCLGESIDRLVLSRKEDSNAVDAEKVAKYWSWRTSLLLDRYVEQRRAWMDLPAPPVEIVDLDHATVAADYATAATAIVNLGSRARTGSTAAALDAYLVRSHAGDDADAAAAPTGSNGEHFTTYVEWLGERVS